MVLPCSLGLGSGALPSERALSVATVFTAVDRVVRPTGCVVVSSSCSSCHDTLSAQTNKACHVHTKGKYTALSRQVRLAFLRLMCSNRPLITPSG